MKNVRRHGGDWDGVPHPSWPWSFWVAEDELGLLTLLLQSWGYSCVPPHPVKKSTLKHLWRTIANKVKNRILRPKMKIYPSPIKDRELRFKLLFIPTVKSDKHRKWKVLSKFHYKTFLITWSGSWMLLMDHVIEAFSRPKVSLKKSDGTFGSWSPVEIARPLKDYLQNTGEPRLLPLPLSRYPSLEGNNFTPPRTPSMNVASSQGPSKRASQPETEASQITHQNKPFPSVNSLKWFVKVAES